IRWPHPTAQYGHTLCTTRSAVAVRLTTFSVALLRAAAPRPRGSGPVSCRNTGHASSQVFTGATLPLLAPLGAPEPAVADDDRPLRFRRPACGDPSVRCPVSLFRVGHGVVARSAGASSRVPDDKP